MAFQPKTLDYELSPYTGMTRQSWMEAGIWLLEGVFKHISDMDAPIVLPRQDYEIIYPNKNTPAWKVQAEYFEGLTRTMFIAAPLIHENPALTIHGICLRDYYKKQILRAVTPGDPHFVRTYSDMQAEFGGGDDHACYQQTVETCALVIDLEMCHEEIWDTYTKEEQDLIAAFLTDYAENPTCPQNWRLFNMLDYAFLYRHGYPIDEEIMRDHAQAVLHLYAGEGWYRDGRGYDYYSCWAFNLYSALWNTWYGYEKEPYIASKFEENSNQLMKTYPDWFDRDGFTNMWGRSSIYRFAATSAFDGNLLMRNSEADPGLARRIASGSLLQFFSRDDFCFQDVPTLGFYGQFLPLVQGYSCAESPYWMGKAFLCLHLPADHPFWTAKEHNGTWEKLPAESNKVTVLNSPGLCITQHGSNGEVELRTGKVIQGKEDLGSIRNYGKLVYNTKFPWESTVGTGIESQQYTLRIDHKDSLHYANVTLWAGEKDHVLYRRQYFDFDPAVEKCWFHGIDLADFSVPYGMIRADKIISPKRPEEFLLGSYGFPDNGTEILRKEQGKAKAIVLKGHDHTGKEKQLAMTIFDGFDSLDLIHSQGTNPDSENSILLYAHALREKNYGYEKYFLISQVITKESLEDFTEEELFPIQEIHYSDAPGKGGYGPVRILLKNGEQRTIDFYGIEGKLSL